MINQFTEVDIIPILTYKSMEDANFYAASHGQCGHTMKLIQFYLQDLAKFLEEAIQEAFDEDKNANVFKELLAATDTGE